MILKYNEGKTILFHNTKMIFKNNVEQATILMVHPPLVGPALHIHPNGQETFFILEGEYMFTIDTQIVKVVKGDFVIVPANTPHKYKSGQKGGQVLVTTPPEVKNYFVHIADELLKYTVSQEYEFEYAKQNGQIFLDNTEHWK